MLTTTIELQDVQINGPFTGKKGTFFVHNLISEKGIKFGVFRNSNEQIESVGDTVHIAYESTTKQVGDRTFTNNTAKKVELQNSEVPFNTVTTSEPTALKTTTTNPKLKTKGVGTATLIGLPNKDISMEVSGLLQALINSGSYDLQSTEGRNTLEAELRLALNLKRKIASELEQTGGV